MKKKPLLILFFIFFFQVVFAQKKDVKSLIREATEAFSNNDYQLTLLKIDEVRIEFKKNSPPPRILSMEIISKCEIIKINPLNSFELIVNTRNLINSYLKSPYSIKDKNYNAVLSENKILITYPKDLETFNAIKEVKQRQEALEREQKQREIALEKERLERIALVAKQKAEVDRIKKIEEEKRKKIILERKEKLQPYVNPAIFSDDELVNLSENEFNEKLDKVIQENIEKQEQEKKIKDLENQRLTLLQPYLSYVNSYDRLNLGVYSEVRFEEIFQKAKSDFKSAEKKNKPRLGAFSSLGFQSGEIAKYGFIYESGGRKFVGFRLTGRTSLVAEEDILNGIIVENKTELELGPNFRIFDRVYLNLGVGYGYYDRLINNDYAGDLFVEKTGYTVATAGLMLRLSRVISMNGGVSFMDIDKEFYKPEITFGISFNLKGKYKN